MITSPPQNGAERGQVHPHLKFENHSAARIPAARLDPAHEVVFQLSDPAEIAERWEQLAKAAEFRSQNLAKILNVSIRTVQRHFQHHYEMPLHAWLRSVRLNEGFSRIAAGEPIKTVAFDLGYRQLSHFSRAFKTFHGVIPSAVQKSFAGSVEVLQNRLHSAGS